MKKTLITALLAGSVLVSGCSTATESFKEGFRDGAGLSQPPTEVEGDVPARVGEVTIPPASLEERQLAIEENLRYEAYRFTMQDSGIDPILIDALYRNGIPLAICEAFNAGENFYDVIMVGVEYGELTPDQSGFLTGVAIGGWCPEHANKIPE